MSQTSRLDLERHKRHLLLKEIGGPGVQKLDRASVSIIGAGALGGPCAMYLAAAGVGQIEIWDDDVADRSNLQRQIQFGEADVGQSKAMRLAARLQAQNSELSVVVKSARFAPGAAVAGDILIDATDNYQSRFALNALAVASRHAMVHGAAARWSGQVAVFAAGLQPGAPCYRCWVPEEPPEEEACDAVGVAGPVTGLVATRMALETLKLITGAGVGLIGKVWLLDGLSGEARTVGLRADSACPECG